MRHECESRERYLGRGEWFTGAACLMSMRESVPGNVWMIDARKRAVEGRQHSAWEISRASRMSNMMSDTVVVSRFQFMTNPGPHFQDSDHVFLCILSFHVLVLEQQGQRVRSSSPSGIRVPFAGEDDVLALRRGRP